MIIFFMGEADLTPRYFPPLPMVQTWEADPCPTKTVLCKAARTCRKGPLRSHFECFIPRVHLYAVVHPGIDADKHMAV